MASSAFRCRLITPEAVVLDGQAASAVVPLSDGLMGILPERAPLVAQLGTGSLKIEVVGAGQSKGGSLEYFVDDGFVQMLDNSLTILAAQAIDAEKLNEQQAQSELQAANSASTEGLTANDLERVQKNRRRAEAKLRAARSFKSHGSH